MATPTPNQKKWVSGQLQTPTNGPGFTPPRKLGKVQKPSTDLFKRPVYDGAELRPYSGRPDANDHMNCGTVVGGVWKPYTPPGLHLVGAAGPVVLSAGGGRRFAK